MLSYVENNGDICCLMLKTIEIYVRRSGRIRRKSHDLVLRYRPLKIGIDFRDEIFFFFSNERLSISTTFPIRKYAEYSLIYE